ncbi:multicopper oxidase mco [bacterium BMS3Bbin02]|nr:multicopper oxidase mco [bacterium BMS3Bbin02]
MTEISRRTFVKLAGVGAASTVLAACGMNRSNTQQLLPQPVSTPNADFQPDVEIALRAVEDTVEVRSGTSTDVWRLEGDLLKGDPGVVVPVSGSYLGPTLHLKKGQKVRIEFTNELPEVSIIHWHGLHVPADMDGHPQYAIAKGETYYYEFEVLNRAGTYWYHPHPHGRTGPQVYAGMAGFFIVSDDEEAALGLPTGDYDIPLVLQDRTFDDNGQFVYNGGGMMDQMIGFLGDELLVNGTPDFTLSVANRAYRLRFLNGSNSRMYKLGWSDGTPFTVIGTDGGLLEKPVTRPYLTLAPAERLDIWVDFDDRSVGSEMKLVSLPFDNGNMNSPEFPILTATIDREASGTVTLPLKLSTPNFFDISQAEQTREIVLAQRMGRGWSLNGRQFEMTGVAQEETIRRGSIEIWEFVNKGGGGMGGGMSNLPHPMHMHGESFKVIERQINGDDQTAWDTLSEGVVDEGWKDTVLVMPGQRVKVLRRFGDFTGLFLYHCHNLEHEDQGMMRNLKIQA